MKKAICLAGVVVGIIAIIVGFSVLDAGGPIIGRDGSGIRFGADFYTEIYDVTQDVGRAVNYAARNICAALGWMTVILGAFIILFFAYKYATIISEQKRTETTSPIVVQLPAEKQESQSVPAAPAQEATPPAAQPSVPSLTVMRSRWEKAIADQGEYIGTCEMCGKKRQDVVLAEFEDFFGKGQRDLCFDCFSKRDCTPIRRTPKL